MIELDEPVVLPQDLEYARCTCLDRARIALEQTGQHTCAAVMGELQEKFDVMARCYGLDSNKPVDVMRSMEKTIDQVVFPWILEHGGFSGDPEG